MEKYCYDYFVFKKEVNKPEDVQHKDEGTICFEQNDNPTETEIQEEVRRRKYPHLNWDDYKLLTRPRVP